MSLDGVRSSGEEILVVALFSPAKKLACWLPPQAGCPPGKIPAEIRQHFGDKFSQ